MSLNNRKPSGEFDINGVEVCEGDTIKLSLENAAWDEPVVYHKVVHIKNGVFMAGDNPLVRNDYAPYTIEVINNQKEDQPMVYSDKAGNECFYLGTAAMANMIAAINEAQPGLITNAESFTYNGYDFKLNRLLDEGDIVGIGEKYAKIARAMREKLGETRNEQ